MLPDHFLKFRIDKTAKPGAWITKRLCNFECTWCHHDYFSHNGFAAIGNAQLILAVEKVLNATQAKEANIRITGDGEPTIVGEDDLSDLIKRFQKIPQVSKIKLTTNGLLLGKMAKALYKSNIDQITVSMHSLDPKLYYLYTRRNVLSKVLESIDIAYSIGVKLKINAIYWKYTADQIDDFEKLSSKYNGLTIKFIDLLIQSKKDEEYYLPLEDLEKRLIAHGAKIIAEEMIPYPKKIYQLQSGAIFELKNAGRLNNCPNIKCAVRDICLEGCRHSIRIGLDGMMRPCGVRNDNVVNLLNPHMKDSSILQALRSGGKID